MPPLNAIDMGILQTKLFKIFNNNEFENIKDKISLHKLTYKNIDKHEKENTYYEYILQKS